MKVKSQNEVTPSCPTLRDPMDCSLPGSSVPGILQARVLEWVAIAFSETQQCILLKTHINIIQSVKYEKVERSEGDEVRSLSGYPRKELSQGNSNIAAT